MATAWVHFEYLGHQSCLLATLMRCRTCWFEVYELKNDHMPKKDYLDDKYI